MTWRERIIDDGTDKERWLGAREPFVTASEMKMFARPASVNNYVTALLKPKSFSGNELTESGHRWEPMILAYLGVPGNTALVRAADNDRIACTVDGISESDPFTLAECKTRHGLIKPEPDAGEWRQLAGQLFCFPEAQRALFGTLTLIKGEHGEWVERKNGYSRLEIPRDHPKIVAATELIIPIAEQVIAALDAAKQILKEVPF